jgi:putative endonuclease
MASWFRKPRPDPSSGDAGRRAEALAAEHLIAHGLTIVDRNFRTRFGEIDLIARDGTTLVFVEVRMRSSAAYGGGIESISSAKRARLIAAANGYLATLARDPPCRFDAVVMQRLTADSVEWRRSVLEMDH